jgi:hypothetical protein
VEKILISMSPILNITGSTVSEETAPWPMCQPSKYAELATAFTGLQPLNSSRMKAFFFLICAVGLFWVLRPLLAYCSSPG